MQTDWKPAANYLLVAVPERFEQQHTPGKARLFLPSGSDDYEALDAQIRLGVGVEIEADEVEVPVRTGLVLAVPLGLTEDMMLCAGPRNRLVPKLEAVLSKGKTLADLAAGGRLLRSTGQLVEQNIPRTAADITQQAEVGDTIQFDPAALTDEAEVMPGVYLIGYDNVICKFENQRHFEGRLECWRDYMQEFIAAGITNLPGAMPSMVFPIAGYVLLARVWPNTSADIISGIDMPPLANEGIVAWVGMPLRGTIQQYGYKDRVIIDERHSRVETIAGIEYIAIRHDYILAIRTND